MGEVIGLDAGRRAAVTRRQILEEFDAQTGCGSEAGDMEPRAEHVIETLLFRPVIDAFAGHSQAKQVSVKAQASFGIAHGDGRVVDSKEQLARRRLPLGIALAGGKLQDFKRVAVWILEVEGLDATCGLVPVW